MTTQSPLPPEQTPREGRPFAYTVQIVLVVVMTISFLMIAQQFNRDVYYYGVLLLIGSTLLQIAFGNIPSHFNFAKSLISVLVAAVIIGGLIILSINLVPTLISLGR